ncbi:MAG: hypothetical protein PVS3B3_07630 [Ktedonobacteraceae bacterium]
MIQTSLAISLHLPYTTLHEMQEKDGVGFARTMPHVLPTIHNNQQLFSDHYLDETLPQRQDWQDLLLEATPVMSELTSLFQHYIPSDKEAQLERDVVRPILNLLGHTFEVQPSLTTPDGTKVPDYVFYRDQNAVNANKGKRLDDTLLQSGAFAVGDAKYWDCPLDIAIKYKGGDPFTNKNPSYQIAFYIQHSGLDWGILTNGRKWRLYHKTTAHKLDHYYEVDLLASLESGNINNFLYFYAFFRRTAFDQHTLSINAILKESIDYAQGIGESLKVQVYDALRLIAQGFLDYPLNALTPDNPDTLKQVYDNALILLYRLLFVLYAEARDLLSLQSSNLYRAYYSLASTKEQIAEHLDTGIVYRSNSAILSSKLKQLFDYINMGDPPLYISTFNGGLFDPERHSFLERYKVSDERMQLALDMLTRIDKHFIDYRDLSVRNLGTIYEGLLEYHLAPSSQQVGWSITLLSNDSGERKATGSYYTPDYIVKYIVEQTIGPRLQTVVAQATDEEAQVQAILTLKVLDPSMGSGHFLVEATEYIARFLAESNIQKTNAGRDLAYWKRRVVQSCIYGVDLNPLAVELAKLSLWLSTVAKDRPLSFLDHHLRTGNALIGARLSDITTATNGNGTSKKKKTPKEQLSLFDDDIFRQNITTAVDLMWLVKDSPAQTVEQVKEQEHLYTTMREGLVDKYGQLANLITATSYGVSVDPTLWKPLVDFATGRITIAPPQFKQWLDAARDIAAQRRFFHWELEFPEVFFEKYGQAKASESGFDVVVGNPPWIRQEAFSADKDALKRLYHVYRGGSDLYTYFVELGNTSLADGGRFGFLVPNKFVRASYGEALREFLSTTVQLERLVDFGDLPIFHDAITYPIIVLTSKPPNGERQDIQVKYTQLKHLDKKGIGPDVESSEILMPPSAFKGADWSLHGEEIQAIVEKTRALGTPLGEYVNDEIFYGIKTGFNEAFVIDKYTRDKLINEDIESANIIKPFVVGRDVKKYRVDDQQRYIILTKIGTPIKEYPAIFAHLQKYQAQLEIRSDKGPNWWELRACDYYDAFEHPKIIFPDIAIGCQFALDRDGMYSTNTTYILPIDESQEYLVPLLNSSLVEFFFKTISALLRGGYLRFFTQYVTQIPIRRIMFTTLSDERRALTEKGIALYKIKRHRELLDLVTACLANEPEQSDVVHDLLIYLAEQMLDFNKQRQEVVGNFLIALEVEISPMDLQRIGRLWTPPTVKSVDEEELDKKQLEVREVLGSLATQVLELREDIGLLNEEQWKWLLKRRLVKPDLVSLVKIYRKFQPSIAELDLHIRVTNKLIDRIVYRLYKLTPEEIAVVEG